MEVNITILLICISQSILNIIYRNNYINIMESTVHIMQNGKSNELFLSYLGGIQNNSLSDILDINDTEINELQIIRCSSCYDFDKFNDFAKKNKCHFSILSTNMQSLN